MSVFFARTGIDCGLIVSFHTSRHGCWRCRSHLAMVAGVAGLSTDVLRGVLSVQAQLPCDLPAGAAPAACCSPYHELGRNGAALDASGARLGAQASQLGKDACAHPFITHITPSAPRCLDSTPDRVAQGHQGVYVQAWPQGDARPRAHLLPEVGRVHERGAQEALVELRAAPGGPLLRRGHEGQSFKGASLHIEAGVRP